MSGPDIPDNTQMIPQIPGASPVSVQPRTPNITALGGAKTSGVSPYNPANMKAAGGAPPGDPRMDAIMQIANQRMGGI